MKKKIALILILGCICGLYSGCQPAAAKDAAKNVATEASEGKNAATEAGEDTAKAGTQGSNEGQAATAAATTNDVKKTDTPQTMIFRDVFGEEYELVINPNVAPNPYDPSKFKHAGDKLSYEDDGYDCLLGIDVSHHQGAVDWASVKAAGYDFAFLRIGYRGYGKAGNVCKDREFERNLTEARKAGVLVGVYFFAQAINEAEAQEEATAVLSWLDGRKLDLPIVYDPESILDDEARTDNVTGEQFTKNTARFCERVAEAGYEPMIYANMLWEAYELDLEKLSDYPIWYADYEALPQTPYAFAFWQYGNEGRVTGVSGDCDLNIWMRKK